MKKIVFISMIVLALACEGEPDSSKNLEVEVTHQGAGDSVVLGYASTTVGHKETLAAELSLDARGVVNGKDSPTSAISPLTFALSLEVTEVSERDLRAKLVVDKLAVGDSGNGSELGALAYKRLSRAIKRMPEISGELVITPTGFVTKLEVGTDKGVSNQQRQVIELVRNVISQLLVPRPSSIAAGGKWKASVNLTRNGFAVAQAQEATLEKDGSIRLTFEENTPKDLKSVSPPGVYADSVALDEYAGGGSGRLVLDKGLVFPREAALELSAKTAVTLEQAGRTDKVLSKARLAIKAKSE
ncbi:MAG: hypothetical protein KJO07_02640 [Deltaproteobacteria bacterium]|nr:hypothetical protein [Deltaproteobacteria bacterium]